ncbi:MAG: PmoA family protein [Planctomycetes bacterium]|nr:PmoA family protein [Planctomycetota bacterium]
MKRLLLSLSTLLLIGVAARAEAPITITGGKEDQKNVLVVVPINEKVETTSISAVSLKDADGKVFRAQLAPSRLLSGKGLELHILIPELKAGQTLVLTPKFTPTLKPSAFFAWGVDEGMEVLSYNGLPVVRYFHKTFDPKQYEPKKEIANPTTKPYHHLYAADGKTIVTNSNQGQYPHHRGIYFGFNNISYDGKKADVWHCRASEHTAHEKVLAAEAGALFGRHTLQIAWNGQDGKNFANERRELAVYDLPGGKLIEFQSELTTPLEKVRLDGDPQHAGFHFRANSAMEKNTKETFFIRPDGKGESGKEKNWVPKDKSGPVNLPWNAMSFMLEGKRYTVVYLDHPNNPKEARQSERAYGRIGTYFEYDLTKDKPLKIQYRLWFQEGEPTVEQCAALSQAFVKPVAVK